MPIVSFKDRRAAGILRAAAPGKGFPADLVRPAKRKLLMLNAARTLADLRFPPGNRLEALAGSRTGQHSVPLNDQFRVCFVWTEGGPTDVEIVDYH